MYNYVIQVKYNKNNKVKRLKKEILTGISRAKAEALQGGKHADLDY